MPEKPSIAVLPFDNLSGSPDDTIFSDGITEDIITGLARFRSLFVVARNSSFAFRGEKISMPEIGRRLGVSYLLEGSVRRAGGRIRITAQLIESQSGAHVWAERYDRNLEDVFAVQDEVTQMIVATLFGRIEEATFRGSLDKPTSSLAAYDYVLRGLVFFRSYGDDTHAMFEKAVECDPRYGLAHAYCALTKIAVHGYVIAPEEIIEEAFHRANHGLELDPQESRCHRVIAMISLFRRDYDTAEHHARKAVELNPNYADGCSIMAYVLASRGRSDEALGWIGDAMRLNPCHASWYHYNIGVALYSIGRFADAAQSSSGCPAPVTPTARGSPPATP